MAQKRKLNQDNFKKQLQETEERCKRAVADYQNLQKRTEKEKEDFLKFATSSLITKFLIILDGLEAAQEYLKNQGLDLLIKEFKEILKQEGVVEIISPDQIFDPEIHECFELVETKNSKLDGKIVEEIRKGYRIQIGEKSQVLRYTQVKVGKKLKIKK